MCDFVSQLLLYHYRRSPHIARELVAIFPEVTAHLLSGAHEVYAEDFLDIFFNFIPPRVPATVDPASPVVAPAVDAEDAKNAPEPPPLRYHESVEIFVTSRLFQRALRQALGGGINASTANLTAVLAASSRLGVERWRALQIVQRLIEMCVPEVDEALIISGALQRALELFFEFPHHSMVHCLVLDMLKVTRYYRWCLLLLLLTMVVVVLQHMLHHSSEFTACWTFLEFGLINRGLKRLTAPAVLTRGRLPSNEGHLVAFFNELDVCLSHNGLLSEAVASSLEVNDDWNNFRTSVLPQINKTYKYASMPDKVERAGTFIERLQQAESDDGKAVDGSPQKQQRDVVEEEVTEEEIVEEIIEEIIEE